MRALFAAVLLSALSAGCTPYIPVRADFGTSAAVPAGQIPPEFEAFNAYSPTVNPLLATQLCATPVEPETVKFVGGSPGKIVQAQARCETHIPLLGP